MSNEKKLDLRVQIQKFGRFLSGMVMPNIGAFIAWGIITALFIPTGWYPNENIAKLVEPMIKYLLPLLIGYTGGKMVHDVRGGVIGAVATLGVIVGSSIPMFLGAMLVGPLSAFIMKRIDKSLEGKVRSGFEMLVNNFSLGIVASIFAIASFLLIGPLVSQLSELLSSGVEGIVFAGLLPIANLFIEPGKILFLNNAINHGILSPMGLQESAETGKSIFFLLEANPGPGLGILLAFWFVGKGLAKQSSIGASIIHFFGGIHEIYFPYVLMNPYLLLAVIGGGISGTFTFQLLHAGLVAAPSPGSIVALLAMSPKGGILSVLAGVLVSTVISFLIASFIIKISNKDLDDNELQEATQKIQSLKENKVGEEQTNIQKTNVNLIVFACDAGMGSSAMGASLLRKKFEDAGLSIEVINKAINEIPSEADIVITQQVLTERAKTKVSHAEHISVENFLTSPKYDELVKRFL